MKILEYFLSAAAAAMIVCIPCQARKFSASANLIGYARLGTLNAELSYSPARHWSVTAGARYNPWTFRTSGQRKQFQMRQQSYALGARFWPWHVYSGWWIAGKLQYQEYNMGGIISRRTEEGDRAGVGFTAGYAYMLSENLNLEFGLGFWGGVKQYTEYTCPACGVTVASGIKGFILPDDLIVSISYVF